MDPNDDQNRREEEPEFGWFVSVSFWSSLFIAVALYACVALAPKLDRFVRLRHQHLCNQLELVDLEQRVQQLDRVASALEEDPQFSAELARMRFRAGGRNESQILVDSELQIETGAVPAAVKKPQLPWYSGLLTNFASNRKLRLAALVTSGLLVLIGFGFLHSRYERQVRTGVGGATRIFRGLTGRYHKPLSE